MDKSTHPNTDLYRWQRLQQIAPDRRPTHISTPLEPVTAHTAMTLSPLTKHTLRLPACGRGLLPPPAHQTLIRVGLERVHAKDAVRNRMILMAYHTRQHVETVLFLGAGASVFAGMPTTKDLVDGVLQQATHQEKWDSPMAANLARNIVRDHADKDVEDLYKTIRDMKAAEELHQKAMKHKMAGDGHPITWKREILTTRRGHPDNETKKDETKDIDENIKTLESMEMAIRNTLLGRLMVKPDRINDVVERYDELFEQTKANTIITTNYDNVLETYCEQAGLGIINGFKKSQLGNRRIWDTDTWNDDEYYVDDDGEGILTAQLVNMRLVKLHGSITWQKGDDSTVLEIGGLGPRDPSKDVMILPTLGKKDYSHGIFPELWRQFEKVLARTELLVVVGFSFRDPQINRMLRGRLRMTDNRPSPMGLLYVDPDPGPDKLERLVGSSVKPREIHLPDVRLLDYSQANMPRVYAYKGRLGPKTFADIKPALEFLRGVMRL